MLRNYVMGALRNLLRYRLYAAINIIGLSVGFAAVLLIMLFVRVETGYDTFWPDSQRVFMVSMDLRIQGVAPWKLDACPPELPAMMQAAMPEAIMVRLMPQPHALRVNHIESNEQIMWADPQVFSVLRMKVLAGDLATSLARPEGMVLTQHIARKLFGDQNPIGRTIEVDRVHSMRVNAVIEDLPDNSHLSADVFASGLATFAGLGALDAVPAGAHPSIGGGISAYIKLPSESARARAATLLQAAADSFLRANGARGLVMSMGLIPIAAVHLSPPAAGFKPRGDPSLLYAISAIGLLIVTIAGINCVSLMTVLASRRAIEIGVRKASGATTGDIILQFIGEAVFHCLIALLVALALVEALAPHLGGYLREALPLRYFYDPSFLLAAAVLGAPTGVATGAYPALLLARFRPAEVLKGLAQTPSGSRLRKVLIVFQFSVLIVLILATILVYRQVQYGLHEGLRINKDQVLVIMTSCRSAFADEVRRLPGVAAAACTESSPFGLHGSSSEAVGPDGTEATISNVAVEPGLFELFGLRPVAGRFFSRDRPADLQSSSPDGLFVGPVVINETAAHKLGFSNAAAAVGQTIRHPAGPHSHRTDSSQIVGIAPDFPEGSVRNPIQPVVFDINPAFLWALSAKLTGRSIPETLDSVDRLWRQTGEPKPIERFFVEQYLEDQYADDIRQGEIISCFTLVALLVGCLGLFGLAALTAQRRTREVGIRKALGASRRHVVQMLVWQLTQPVLWANLVAWPLAYYFANRWLEGFTYHTDLSLWMFLLAGGVALTIAAMTVLSHALTTASAKPARVLRHE